MNSNRISVKVSNSPLGGGSVRVYVGDTVVWTKRIQDLAELLEVELKVKQLIRIWGVENTARLKRMTPVTLRLI